MRLKKIAFIMVMVLCLGSLSNVYAEDFNEHSVKKSAGYETRWENVFSTKTSINEADSQIIASARIISKNNLKISGRLYLQKKRGGHWSTVKSWGVKGKGLVEVFKKYSGDAGKYRTKLFVNVEGEYITTYSSEEYFD